MNPKQRKTLWRSLWGLGTLSYLLGFGAYPLVMVLQGLDYECGSRFSTSTEFQIGVAAYVMADEWAQNTSILMGILLVLLGSACIVAGFFVRAGRANGE